MLRTPAVTVAKLLNDAATAYRAHQLHDETEEIDPYDSLGFQEFRSSNEALNYLKNPKPSYHELNDSSEDNPDMSFNELGDYVRGHKETLVFTPNAHWRSAHGLVNQTDWIHPSVKVTTATPSMDVCMQQSFIKSSLEMQQCLHKNVKTNSIAFSDKQS